MTKTLSRRALLRAAPAIPVAAIAAPVAATAPVLPDWQAYICDITKDVHPGAQRFLKIAAETVAKRPHTPEPFRPGPIEELLIEYRRRSRLVCDRASAAGVDIESHEVDWIDEPLHEGMTFMPDNRREFAAFFVLCHLDDAIMADNYARNVFVKCEAMLA